MSGGACGFNEPGVDPRPPKSKLRDLGTVLNGAPPPEDTVRPDGRGRAGKEGRRLWGPIPGEIVPGLCLSIPLNKESLIVWSLKLWDRVGRAVKTSVRTSAGDTVGSLSHDGN